MSVSCFFTNTSGFPGLGRLLFDGWVGRSVGRSVGGWVGLIFFGFGYFSKTTLYIILIVFGPPSRRFEVSSVKKLKKKNKKINFVKKFRTFRKIFGFLTIFEKITRKSLVFWPTMVAHSSCTCCAIAFPPPQTPIAPKHPHPPTRKLHTTPQIY